MIKEIIKAQDYLHRIYNEEEYKRLIETMIRRTENNIVLMVKIANDKELPADIRLIAIACMGE